MSDTPKYIVPASELREGERFCQECERELKEQAAWLELDQRDWTCHDDGGVPPEHSQGWFVFGLTCARRHIRKHRHSAAV